MQKDNENITYTRGQLEAFTVKELRKVDLYERAEIKTSVSDKDDIINDMMDFQALEKEMLEEDATSETTEETIEETIEEVEVEEEEVEDDGDTEEEAETEEGEFDGPPVFHRSGKLRKSRSRMTMR